MRITRNGEDKVCKLKVTKQKDGEYGQELFCRHERPTGHL